MRSSKKRSRSNQNRPRSLGNIVNRVFDSSGPEGKVRGTPQQIIEKYQTLARDAQLSNDRVAAENFLQHAEHYTRMLAEAQRELAQEQEARQQQYQQNGNGQNGSQNGGQNAGHNGGQGGNNRGEYRDRNDRNDRSNDQRGENRHEQRAPREDNRQPVVAAEVIDFGGESSGLVDLPESTAPVNVSVTVQDRALPDHGTEAAQAAPQDEPAADTPLFASARKSGDATDAPQGEGRGPRNSRAPRGDKAAAGKTSGDKAPRNSIRQPRGEASEGAAESAGEEAKPRRVSRPRKAAAAPAADGAPEAAE